MSDIDSEYYGWKSSLPEPPFGPLLHNWASPEKLELDGPLWEGRHMVFCGNMEGYYHYLYAEQRLLREWITEKDLEWLRKYGEPFPADLESMIRFAERFGIPHEDLESLGRGRAVAFVEGRLDLAVREADTPDNKTDSRKENAKFLNPPVDVRRAARYLRKNHSEKGSKIDLIRQFTEGDQSEADRLSKALQPKRYGWLLEGTRFNRTSTGQSA